ncbi:hypothetical protein DYH09_22045 [bacterium CPR1]|nr:hypothetical protein [bacterium CPR1]
MLLALIVLSAGCSGVGGGGGATPPVTLAPVGSYLEYSLVHTDRNGKSQHRKLRLTFLAGNELGLGEEKKPIAALDSQLAPTDGQPLPESNLGLLYLSPAQRKASTPSRAGLVQFEKRWERWSVWQVQVREGDLSGQRYYDARTGFLVGYELNQDDPNRSKGGFVKVILDSTDLPGL